MKINKIQITAFGKLKNFEMALNDKFNLVFGDNEAGKSTVMAFIKMALYGSSVRGSSLDNPRVKFLPFDSSQMGGVLYFTHDRINYRLDCKFGATPAKDKIILFNDDTSEIVNLGTSQSVGEYFFDLGGQTFESTAFIQSITPSGGADEIAKHLSSITGADESVSPELVKKRLVAAKDSQFTKRRVGAGDKIADQIEKLKKELQDEKDRAKMLSGIKAEISQKQAEIEKKKQRKAHLTAVVNMAGNIHRYEQLNELIKVHQSKNELGSLCKGANRDFISNCHQALWNCNNLQNTANNEKAAASKALSAANVNSLEQASEVLEQTKAQFEKSKKRSPLLRTVLIVLGVILVFGGVAAQFFTSLFAYPFIAVGVILSVLGITLKNKKGYNTLQLQQKISALENAISIAKQSNTSNQKAVDSVCAFVNDIKKLDTDATFETAKQTLDRFERLTQVLQDKTSSFAALSQALGVSYDEAVKELESMPKTEVTEQQIAYAKDELNAIEQTLTSLVMSVATLNERLNSSVAHKGAAQIEREIYEAEKDLKRRTLFANAADLANEVLADAYSQLRQSFGPQLNQKTAELFAKLTKGKYDQIKVSHDLTLTAGEQGAFSLIDLGYLSAGTADQAYIALRLAVAGLLANGNLPIFLDDAFLQFDHNRESVAFELLSEISKQQQIMFFTCKGDTAKRAQQVGANLINM